MIDLLLNWWVWLPCSVAILAATLDVCWVGERRITLGHIAISLALAAFGPALVITFLILVLLAAAECGVSAASKIVVIKAREDANHE